MIEARTRRILESIKFLFLLSKPAARPHVPTRNASSRSKCDKIDRLDLSDQPLSPKFDALVTLTLVHECFRIDWQRFSECTCAFRRRGKCARIRFRRRVPNFLTEV